MKEQVFYDGRDSHDQPLTITSSAVVCDGRLIPIGSIDRWEREIRNIMGRGCDPLYVCNVVLRLNFAIFRTLSGTGSTQEIGRWSCPKGSMKLSRKDEQQIKEVESALNRAMGLR
jgi:hypothetical protein